MAGFTIRNEIGATVFSILSGLSILFFTAWAFSPGGCARPEDPAISPLPSAAGGESSPEEQVAATSSEAESEASRRAELALSLRESEEARQALEEMNKALRATNAETDEQLQRWNALLSEAEGGDAGVAGVMSRLAELEEKNQVLTARLAETPEADLEALEAENDKLKEQLKSEKKACEGAKAGLQREIDSLRKELDQALYGDRLKPAGDFPALTLPFLVSDPIQLNQKVRPVFIELRGVDEENADLEKIYGDLTAEGAASAPHTVPFSVGSAEVTKEETEKLETYLGNVTKETRFLVVGYASTDGDAKSNYELSSKRASSVAAALAANDAVSRDSVQAVYFGQTSRFSASEMAPNRIVEVWRVK